MTIPFVRSLKPGMSGADVEAVKRATYRALGAEYSWKEMIDNAPVVRRKYTKSFAKMMKRMQSKLGVKKLDGVYGRETHEKLARARAAKRPGELAFDARARYLLRIEKQRQARIEAERQRRLEQERLWQTVIPSQGLSSLSARALPYYSLGRNMGLSDCGTYNPASRLPGGGPSDHSVYPSRAFDLCFSPHTGFDHPVAQRYYYAIIGKPGIKYVILGDRIWSPARGTHTYFSGGHMNHVHVSVTG